jgi:transcription antitermination factor NusG
LKGSNSLRRLKLTVQTKNHPSPQDPWFALKVRTRSELMAFEGLRSRGFEPYAPSVCKYRRYRDRTKPVQRAVFPGYVFCRCEPEDKPRVLSSAAVEYIVSFGGKPAIIPDPEIESVRALLDAGGHVASYLPLGSRVRINAGPLAGLEGLALRRGKEHHFIVSIHLLQRSVSLVIEERYLVT